ncbi:major pollen allergen Aln g 1-like [Phoenix dactylifera]|uniref:Major pollen allergen Aln g 1-like n=1 Tax=Phoenix dactylifera TaxID=42345 RepID=A0A8B9A970_PHODC|nr:major pollen allergen Aln g 1-like [Phoenix dactylifera]XP_038980433.1 major pollen allergen Aln g 1-like [Phoenix dactylifera]
MVAGSVVEECKSTVALGRLWKAGILDVHNLMPRLAPEHISSVEIGGGDGGVGTIKKFNFTDAVKLPANFVKDRVDVLDNEKHVFKYSVVEGGLLGVRLKSYSFDHKFEAASDGSTVGKVILEYETLDDTDLSEEEKGLLMGAVLGMMKAVEGFLLANPDAYA